MPLARVGLMLMCLATAVTAQDTEPKITSDGTTKMSSTYLQIPFRTITGDTASLADFTGKVILLVNTASKCGYTPQYAGLEALYRKYKARGLVVIGFPANDFKQQEPGTNEEILDFCRANFGVTFPLMEKIHVKGDSQHPLYEYLTRESPFPGDITWNFNKFLLDHAGRVVARFDTKVTPDSPEMVRAIEEQLGPP